MSRLLLLILVIAAATFPASGIHAQVTGELKQWHKVTFDFTGPETGESATPNPFTDYRLNVTFTHPGTGETRVVPGYFAADGDAANTSAVSGDVWRVHFAPDEVGEWSYLVSFRSGTGIATSEDAQEGISAGFFDGDSGSIPIGPSDKTGRDFRAKGRLDYVGKHHLRFAGTGKYFMKVGVDAPENLLAYADFDGGFISDGQKDELVKTWAPHLADWQPGDPVWQGTKGKGLIGAINYLASEGLNAFSFLTMNINGDDKNVFPYTTYAERMRLDVSRLAQWEIVFEHGTRMGMHLNFKTQETENELLLDGGDTGPQRKLYYRELIARFGHHLGLNWNLGEEINGASKDQKIAWAKYFRDHDPYHHPIVIHNGATHYNLMGSASELTGFSLQLNASDFTDMFAMTKDYIDRSVAAGKPWVVACDEPGDSQYSLRPDDNPGSSHLNARKNALWGNVLAGGAGCEFYFGYALPNSDLTCNDFRSRDAFWDYCRHLLTFFEENEFPFQQMKNQNALVSGSGDNANRCLAKIGEAYLVQLHAGGSATLDLSAAGGTFTVKWFNPRGGGPPVDGPPLEGGTAVNLGSPPDTPGEDWIVLVRSTSGGSGTNAPPAVNAGPGKSAFLSGPSVEVALDGDVTDDGLPDEFLLTRTWSMVSGPAAVAFSNASAATTTATFVSEGTYVLQLSASDSDLSAADQVAVDIKLPETTGRRIFAPVHDAFTDDGINDNGSFLRVRAGDRITYLRFDLSALDAVPQGSVLRLTEANGAAAGPVTLRLFATASNAWSESTVSGSDPPPKGAELASFTGEVSAGAAVAFDLGPHISQPGIYSFILESSSPEEDVAFASREHPSTAARPLLTVTTVGNSPPVFPGYSLVTTANQPVTVTWPLLLATASDPDGDPVSVPAGNDNSAAGGYVTMGEESLTYAPSIDFAGPDSFPLTVQDGRGGFSTVDIAVQVRSIDEVFATSPAITRTPGQGVQIAFEGLPGFDHLIQRSTDLQEWITLSTVNGGTTGDIGHIDPEPPSGAAFYRIATP